MTASVLQGVVTIMHTDVERSTDLTVRLGDELAQRRILEMKRIIREAVAQHGGREIDNPGDGFMMTFSSTRRAIECAVAIQRALSEQAQEVDGVRVRIGLNVGEVVGADEHPFGAAVNAGARVMAHAKGGEILVSETVRRLAGTMPGISFRDRGRVQIKGFDERWRLYEVVWGRPAAGRPKPSRPTPSTSARPRSSSMRGNRRWLLACAVVVLAVAATAAVVATSRSAQQTLRDVPRNSIGVIDVKTDRLVDAIAIGGRISGIAYGAGSVWAINADGKTLVRIDPSSAKITDTVALPATPTDVAYGAQHVWVASAGAALLLAVDPRYDSIDRRIHLHQAVYNQGLRPSFSPLALGPHGLWIGHNVSALSHIDPRRGTPVAQLTLDEPAVAIADGPNDVWVELGGQASLVAVNPITDSTDGETPLPSFAVNGSALTPGIAVGSGAVWVAVYDTGQVWRIDPATRKPTDIIRVGATPTGVAADAGAVWVANTLAGTVSRIDPHADRVVTTIHVGNQPLVLTVGHDRVWVGVS